MEDLNAIKVIDTATHKVTDTWPIAPGERRPAWPSTANHRLFIGCDNKLMLMVDSTNSKMIYSVRWALASIHLVRPYNKLVFTSDGESGTVTVAREESPTLLKVVQTTDPPRANVALDPTTHTIYLATDYEPQPASSKTRRSRSPGRFGFGVSDEMSPAHMGRLIAHFAACALVALSAAAAQPPAHLDPQDALAQARPTANCSGRHSLRQTLRPKIASRRTPRCCPRSTAHPVKIYTSRTAPSSIWVPTTAPKVYAAWLNVPATSSRSASGQAIAVCGGRSGRPREGGRRRPRSGRHDRDELHARNR
jgi:hypothetical protein